MNMKIKMLALVALAALVSGNGLTAQTVGYVTRTVNAGQGALICTPFDQVPATFTGLTSGVIEGVSATSFTDNQGAWATNFATAAAPFYVKMTNGAAAGRFFRIATASNTATVANLFAGELSPVTAGVVNGDAYEIIAGKTLKTFFDLLDVNQGTAANNATTDNVFIINASGGFAGPYFRNTSGAWRLGAAPSDNVVIRPDVGLYYVRKNANGNLVIPVSGNVPDENSKIAINNGASTLASTSFPVDTTLLNSGIQTTPTWASTNVDSVYILNETTGIWNRYFWNGTAWRLGAAPANNTVILAGQAVLISKGTGTFGTTSIYSRAKPY